MNIIIITRCYKPTNIQRIKDNLKSVFEKQDKISYVQYLLVDLSYNQSQQNFKCFEDEYTKVIFTHNKKDYYNYHGVDQLVNSLPNDENTFVYVLDDDNLLVDDFLNLFNQYTDEDVIMINRTDFCAKVPLVKDQIIGKTDLCMYIVKLNVKKNYPFFVQGQKSFEADGRCLQDLLVGGCKFKYVPDRLVRYSALKRPMNVLRSDL